MPTTWNSRPFDVLVVSHERELLRQISRFLALFRYCVREVASVTAAQEIMQVDPPDFLIVDAAISDQPHRLLHTTNTFGPRHPVYSFLLVSEPSEKQLDEALQAGADDVLTRPLICGELLARLRTAARMTEFDRRYERQFTRDPQSGWLSESEFLRFLERALSAEQPSLPWGCVLIDIDHLTCINRRFGYPTADAFLASVVQRLASIDHQPRCWARISGGRFAAVVDETSRTAEQWAANVADLLADRPYTMEHGEITCTASGAVAYPPDAPTTAEQLWHDVNEALFHAKQSGRECVVTAGQFAEEAREWESWATSGRLFETTLVRDVMTPVPSVLRSDASAAEVWSTLRSAGLPHMPVVDSHGKLIGLVAKPARECGSVTDAWNEALETQVTTFTLETPFAELMDYFAQSDSDLPVVVTQEGRPTGVVYRDGLAALCEELRTDSFAAETSVGTQTLRIPDPSLLAT